MGASKNKVKEKIKASKPSNAGVIACIICLFAIIIAIIVISLIPHADDNIKHMQRVLLRSTSKYDGELEITDGIDCKKVSAISDIGANENYVAATSEVFNSPKHKELLVSVEKYDKNSIKEMYINFNKLLSNNAIVNKSTGIIIDIVDGSIKKSKLEVGSTVKISCDVIAVTKASEMEICHIKNAELLK